MDENGQLVVRIESIEVDQKVLDAIEPPCVEDPIATSPFKDEILTSSSELPTDFGMAWILYLVLNRNQFFFQITERDEQVHFVRPLPDGGFEIVAETEATNFLEIVEDDSSRSLTPVIAVVLPTQLKSS